MADIRATPVSNRAAYYLAGLLDSANEAVSKPFGFENDPVRGLTNLLGVPSMVKTLENVAYGMPNTTGTGMATQLRPEAKETVANLLPMAPGAGKAAVKGAVAAGKYAAPVVGGALDNYAFKSGLQLPIFAGEGAKTADLGKLATAKTLDKAGAANKDIWRQTGWFKGVDGKWRFEIDDSPASFGLVMNNRPQKMQQAFKHEEMYSAYPSLGSVEFTRVPSSSLGNYNGNAGVNLWGEPAIQVSDRLTLADPAKSTLLHELQHVIQDKEGFGRGGNMQVARDVIAERKDYQRLFDEANEATKNATDPIAAKNAASARQHYGLRLGKMAFLKDLPESEVYRRLAGEAESRAVQARMNMTPQERARFFPLDSYDVPINELIVRDSSAPYYASIFNGQRMGLLETPFDKAHKVAQENATKMLGLPPNNTAMDRAKALGFDADAYHATPHDFQQFKAGGNDPTLSGEAIWLSPYKDYYAAAHNIGGYKGNYVQGTQVMPLKVRLKSTMELDDQNMLDWARAVYADGSREFPQLMSPKTAKDVRADYGSIIFDGEKIGMGKNTNEMVIFDPKNIRSSFAAFDPARINEPDLLAAGIPLGLIAGSDIELPKPKKVKK